MDKQTLLEMRAHLLRFAALLDSEIRFEESRNPSPEMPPRPKRRKRVELAIWKVWDKLQDFEHGFTFRDAEKLIVDDDCKYRSNSAYSSILSRWAREGYLRILQVGRGPLPTRYKVRAPVKNLMIASSGGGTSENQKKVNHGRNHN